MEFALLVNDKLEITGDESPGSLSPAEERCEARKRKDHPDWNEVSDLDQEHNLVYRVMVSAQSSESVTSLYVRTPPPEAPAKDRSEDSFMDMCAPTLGTRGEAIDIRHMERPCISSRS